MGHSARRFAHLSARATEDERSPTRTDAAHAFQSGNSDFNCLWHSPTKSTSHRQAVVSTRENIASRHASCTLHLHCFLSLCLRPTALQLHRRRSFRALLVQKCVYHPLLVQGEAQRGRLNIVVVVVVVRFRRARPGGLYGRLPKLNATHALQLQRSPSRPCQSTKDPRARPHSRAARRGGRGGICCWPLV